MEEKVIKFDLSADRLLDMADTRMDEGDYLSALRMLHKSIDLNGEGVDEWVSLADAYDEMEIFELSANCWFRYLDICSEEEAVDAYEGLAACYYNMGNEAVALYYYNKMVRDQYVSPSNNVEMGELFEKQPRRNFKISWPPERADYSDDVDEGLKLLKNGNYAAARECFGRVNPNSEFYSSSQNYTAICWLLEEKPEEAEKVCLAVLEKEPENVQALSTYAAVLAEEGRSEEGYRTAVKLASIRTDNSDEIYKIATVCCENKLYEQAYEKFCILENTVSYDLTLLYFKAVAAFKCEKIEESLSALGKILDIYPDAAVARYYYREIRAYLEEGGAAPETGFFYRVPKTERESRLKFLATLAELRLAELQSFCRETDITELLEWAFDESDGQEVELQILASAVAVRGEMDGFVRGVLLDSTVNDVIKFEILRRLCERNRDNEFGVVIGNVFRKLPIEKLEVGRSKRSKFISAYALCFSCFAVLGEGSSADYRLAAQEVYAALERDGKLDLAVGVESLAGAIYLTAMPENVKKTRSLIQYLGAEVKTVAEILGCVHGLEFQSEAAVTDGTAQEESENSTEVEKNEVD